jgi:AraC-like DNA-binding protein
LTDNLVILSYVGLSQALFAIVLLLTKRPIQLHDRIMIGWLGVIGLRFWLVANGIKHNPFFDIDFSEALIPLTFGPFLYLYCKYLISEESRMTGKDYIHFAPFVTLVFYGIIENSFSDTSNSPDFSITLNLLYLLSTIVYSSLVFILLQKYRKTIRFNFFSYDSSSNRLFWLNYVAVVSVVSFTLYLAYMLANTPSKEANYNLLFISTAGMVMLSFSVSYFGLTQKSVTAKTEDTEHYGFRSIASDLIDSMFNVSKVGRSDRKTATTISNENNQEKEEALTAARLEQIEMLKKAMETEKPFLNPELTLQDLATLIHLPKHQLTFLFNNCMGINFFEFVNEYRIEEAKKRLLDPQYDNLTIIAIAYDCGFNSKSTFNTLFKEMTGHTPSQWRKENNNS